MRAGLPPRLTGKRHQDADRNDGPVGVGVRLETASGEGPAMACPVSFGAASEVGPRSKNDDCFAVNRETRFAAVGDGVGGAPFGDAMSRAAVVWAAAGYERSMSLTDAILEADAVSSLISDLLGRPGSGSTLLLAAIGSWEARFAWVGDSAAYLMRGGELLLITPPDRLDGNMLGSAVGYGESAVPHEASCALAPDDRIILCTDGVWEYLRQDEMAEILSDGDSAAWIAREMVRRAASRGEDNATAVVAIVGGAGIGEARRSDEMSE